MNFSRERPEAFIAEISPVRAKEMLETSAGNRRLRGWYVSQLAAAMRRGEWRVTSQGIGFDTKGRLRDAHHRLNACIESKTNIMSVVVLGLSDDSYQVTDIGINRSYGDRLNMERRVAEVIRLGCQYAIGTTRPTIDQMNPFI